MKICSLPFLSSKRSSLNPPPPFVEFVLMYERVLWSGSLYAGIVLGLGTHPTMIGRSGSPSRKSTMSSMPFRGRNEVPHSFPVHIVATRTQQELLESYLPSRSQWNCTFTRPYLSVVISSPGTVTTNAVWLPRTTGFGVLRGGRYGTDAGMHVKLFVYGCGGSLRER